MMPYFFSLYRRLSCVALLCLLTAVSSPAFGETVAEMNRSDQQLFRRYSRLFCLQFYQYEDQFVILPNHAARREASVGRTYDEVAEDLTTTRRERVGGNASREIRTRPPRGEVIALSMVIPTIDVGHYGHIDSVEIVRVIGEREMIVRALLLINPQATGSAPNQHRLSLIERQKEYKEMTFRLIGFSTADAQPGQRYRGPRNEGLKIAVAGSDPDADFILVNYDRLDRVRVSDFEQVLTHVDLSASQFCRRVRSNREETRNGGDKTTLLQLYQLYYSAFDTSIPDPEPESLSPANEPALEVPHTSPDPPETEPDVPAVLPEEDQSPPVVAPETQPAPEPMPIEEEEEEWEEEDWVEVEVTEEPNFFGIPLE